MSQAGRTRRQDVRPSQSRDEESGMSLDLNNRTLWLIVVVAVVVIVLGVWWWRSRKPAEPKHNHHRILNTGCQSDGECPTGKHCKTSTGLCVECTGDAHCSGNPNGSLCNAASNTCVACMTAADCADGQTCANHACVEL